MIRINPNGYPRTGRQIETTLLPGRHPSDVQLCGVISMGDVTRWVIRTQQEQVNLAINAVKQMGYSNRRG